MSERVIVSMTSYLGRITNVGKAIFFLLTKQTQKPDEIHLWLAEPEFKNREKDLPQDLQAMLNVNNVFLHWVPKNTYCHKRHEIFHIAKEDDCIFIIDDDVVYEYNMLEKFLAISEKLPEACVCFGKFSGALCDQPVVKGGATLYKVRFFTENVWTQLNETIINTNEDDWWYAYNFLRTGKRSIVYTGDELTFFNQICGHGYNTAETHKMYLNMLRQPVVNVIKDKENV